MSIRFSRVFYHYKIVDYSVIYKVREPEHEEKAWRLCVVHALGETKGKWKAHVKHVVHSKKVKIGTNKIRRKGCHAAESCIVLM